MTPLKQFAKHATLDLFSRKGEFRFAKLGDSRGSEVNRRSKDPPRVDCGKSAHVSKHRPLV